MRISVQNKDGTFNPEAQYYGATLDGVLLEACITADEELGIAICYCVPIQIDPDNHEQYLTHTRTGVVKITRL